MCIFSSARCKAAEKEREEEVSENLVNSIVPKRDISDGTSYFTQMVSSLWSYAARASSREGERMRMCTHVSEVYGGKRV